MAESDLKGIKDPNQALAKQLGMPIDTELKEITLSKELLKKVPYSYVKKNIVIPYKEEGDHILVAVADPLHLEPLEELRHMLQKDVTAVYSPKEIIFLAIDSCYQETGAASQLLADMSQAGARKDGDEVEVYDLLDESQSVAPIIKLLNLILTEAIQQGASDVHFDPTDEGLRVRYRIDGVLQNRHSPSPEYRIQLLTRIKVMAKLDIAEHRLPQDGRIKLKLGAREVDFRVSTVPVVGGERIVLRILEKGNVALGLDKLGMLPQVLAGFKKLITLPEGIILVTGPTGSGKTTTLYSAITDLTTPETNIMTIEDPVEYNLKGIAQIGVKTKINLTFATGLRHILRQDPDIIMVGEIRDKETAEIAIQASLTGHLVLSTLHTNDAPSAITRLVDMDIEPYLLSSTVVGVIAQRLVRQICPHCKTTYTPTEEELKSLELSKGDILYKGLGCEMCYNTGYKGRHGLYELMVINNRIRTQIIKSQDAVEMRKIAIETGMSSLFDHGKELCKRGITTITEVLRATKGIEE